MLIPENAALTVVKLIQPVIAMTLNILMELKEKTPAFSHTASHGMSCLQNLVMLRLPTLMMILLPSSLPVLVALLLGSDIKDQPSSKTISLLSGNLPAL